MSDNSLEIFRDENCLIAIGPAELILRAMFPKHYDAHIDAWRKWRFLYQRGIVDKAGIILEGRSRGRKSEAIARL